MLERYDRILAYQIFHGWLFQLKQDLLPVPPVFILFLKLCYLNPCEPILGQIWIFVGRVATFKYAGHPNHLTKVNSSFVKRFQISKLFEIKAKNS